MLVLLLLLLLVLVVGLLVLVGLLVVVELVVTLLLLLTDGRVLPWGQLRSKRALVDRSLVMANLTLFSGLESRRVYQKTFFLPKMAHPTSFQ